MDNKFIENNIDKNNIIRGLSKNARFIVFDSTDLVKEAQKLHKLDPIATMFFGQFLTGTSLLSEDIKGDVYELALKLKTDGIYNTIVAVANSKGEIKGYITHDLDKMNKIIDKNGEFLTDNNGVVRLLGKGVLESRRDIGLSKPFTSVIETNEENMSDIFANFYLNSEQVRSVISLGVKMDENGNILKSGGFVVQLMPNAEEKFIEKLENKIKQIHGVSELLNGGMSLEQIVELLYEDLSLDLTDDDIKNNRKYYVEDFKIASSDFLQYKCNCTKEMYLDGVKSIGMTVINKILEEEGEIKVECHFCDKIYIYTKKDFE